MKNFFLACLGLITLALQSPLSGSGCWSLYIRSGFAVLQRTEKKNFPSLLWHSRRLLLAVNHYVQTVQSCQMCQPTSECGKKSHTEDGPNGGTFPMRQATRRCLHATTTRPLRGALSVASRWMLGGSSCPMRQAERVPSGSPGFPAE